MNRAILIGHLGRDCELRYTTAGAAVATLNLATTESWTDKQGQRKDQTEWHRVVLWGKVAESLQEYLTKGKQIAVEGRIQTRQWTDRDGNKRYTTEIRADRVTLLGGGGNGSDRSTGRRARDRGDAEADIARGGSFDGPMAVGDEIEPATMPITDDDIPF